jgi:hypothetical protein
METVLRFALTRPPEATPPGASVPLDRESSFQSDLATARSSENARTVMKDLAGQFVSASTFVRRLEDLSWGSQLKELREHLQDNPNGSASEIRNEVTRIFGKTVSELAEDVQLRDDDTRAADSLVAAKILPASSPAALGDLVDAVRLVAGVRDLASPSTEDPSDFPPWKSETKYKVGDRVEHEGVEYECRQNHKSQADWPPDLTPALWLSLNAVGLDPWRARAVLGRAVTLPAGIFPLPPHRSEQQPDERPPSRDHEVEVVHERLAHLAAAIDELLAFDVSSLREDSLPPPGPSSMESPPIRDSPMSAEGALARVANELGILLAVGEPTGPAETRRSDAFALRPESAAILSQETAAILQGRGLDPTAIPLDRIVNDMARELDVSARRLARIEERLPAVARVHLVSIGTTEVSIFLPGAETPAPPLSGQLPTTRGAVRPVGVADLLVVKQQLKGYEAQDLAHIENVLQGESKRREHKRSVVTEEFRLTETERVSEEERELESTDRFEMAREAMEIVRQDASLSAGLTVSGKYGPFVSFAANVHAALESSKERSTAQATSYSRDVTSRTVQRVSERIREQRSIRITTSVEETNEHALDNKNGSGHVRGTYQWISKIYESQIFNYGLRTLFDFTVPEPAAFVVHALESGYGDATAVEEPRAFTLTPAMINDYNYHQYVRDWEATGVEPPPEPYITVSKVFRGGPDSPESPTHGTFVDGAEVPLPHGYKAIYANVTRHLTRWHPDVLIDVTVGNQVRRFRSYEGASWIWDTYLGGNVGSIPVAIQTWRAASYTVAVSIKCQRTPRAMEQWRQETHAALLQAYQQKRAVYEEKLNALRARAGVEIAGRNPAANRAIEREELKKSCISILTAQHFDVFGAIGTGTLGIPQLDLDGTELQGAYIRFFEQAFEWENITYLFHPYYWARRSEWVARFGYDDVDPLFTSFLRAGAARVVVPVRPGFELAVDHFLQTGDIWMGEELPPVTSDMYVPIVNELREQQGAPGSEVPVGEPWDVKVPTTLVRLRDDDSLPRWTKVPDGQWVPDEG